jgi:ribonuclease Z
MPKSARSRILPELRLVNGSVGDPALYVDYPGSDNALLFDAGENGVLGSKELGDLDAVFVSHHHVDHFIGFDRIVRANLDRDKALHVYGPEGTIRKVYDRIKSYEYPFFPFQKIVLEIHELRAGRMSSALLECSRRFPKPEIVEQEWTSPVVYETAELAVEAALVDHTVPCLAFALVEKPSRSGAGKRETRIAYITDTLLSDAVRPALIRLARGAKRLYCDSFYAQAQSSQAQKYHHMTASEAAQLALAAEVDQLVLIHFSSRYEGRYESLVEEARAIFPRVSAEIPPSSKKNEPSNANCS